MHLASTSSSYPVLDIPVRPLDRGRLTADLSVRKLDGRDWDDVVAGFKDVLHEQTSCFNELRWRPDQLERLMVFDGTNAIGGAVVRKVRIPVTNKKLAIIRWGPIWRKLGVSDSPETMRTVYEAIAAELSERQKCFVLLIPRADPTYNAQEAGILTSLGFKPGFQPESPERYFVNVDQNLDQLRANLSQKWRYNLKKAEKNGLTAGFESGPEGLREFFNLYSTMVDRKKFFETTPIDTLRYLMGVEHKELRPEILIVRKDGEPVAGAVLDCSGEQAVYLYGATNKEALRLKAGYFMQWEILRFLSGLSHIKWYALGGGTADNCSLHQFKRGLVGKNGVISSVPSYQHLADSASTELIGKAAVSLQLTKGRIQKSIHDRLASLL
ncbi:MAG: lipid II:glycine glycyltransferase FemX [Rhizobiaceae bacterium]